MFNNILIKVLTKIKIHLMSKEKAINYLENLISIVFIGTSCFKCSKQAENMDKNINLASLTSQYIQMQDHHVVVF